MHTPSLAGSVARLDAGDWPGVAGRFETYRPRPARDERLLGPIVKDDPSARSFGRTTFLAPRRRFFHGPLLYACAQDLRADGRPAPDDVQGWALDSRGAPFWRGTSLAIR